MCEELEKLAKDFISHRGGFKYKKFPEDLWERATNLCKQYPVKVIARAIQVSGRALSRRHRPYRNKVNKTPIIKREKAPEFVPIRIESQPSIQIQVEGPVHLSIEFNRSTEELAKLIFALQGELPC